MGLLRHLFILSLLWIVCSANGQTLKRQSFLGIAPGTVSAEDAKTLGLSGTDGILVRRLFPGGSFAATGGLENDVIVSINSKPVPDMAALGNVLGDLDLRTGDPVKFKVIRKGKEKMLSGKAVEKPYETTRHGRVEYDEMPFKEGTIRVIANIPHGDAPFPTIYFIPGYNCLSIDNMGPGHPYQQLLDSLLGLGYAIIKVEKPGMGDNQNTGDCQLLGFDNELEAFLAGYDHLMKYDFVDKSEIYIWGHSMGGVYAPLVAAKKHPKGVVVYGTTHEMWAEYLLKMIRFQSPRNGMAYDSVEATMPVLYKLIYAHYFEGKPSKELYQNPDYKTILDRDFLFDGENQILFRHEDFWREINNHNLTQAWLNSNAHVLSLYGEADFEALNDISHKEIVRIVNQVNPGYGTYKLIPGTSHSMFYVGSMEEGIRLQNSGEMRKVAAKGINYRIVTETHNWIRSLPH